MSIVFHVDRRMPDDACFPAAIHDEGFQARLYVIALQWLNKPEVPISFK
jgi:hypothetical protein